MTTTGITSAAIRINPQKRYDIPQISTTNTHVVMLSSVSGRSSLLILYLSQRPRLNLRLAPSRSTRNIVQATLSIFSLHVILIPTVLSPRRLNIRNQIAARCHSERAERVEESVPLPRQTRIQTRPVFLHLPKPKSDRTWPCPSSRVQKSKLAGRESSLPARNAWDMFSLRCTAS